MVVAIIDVDIENKVAIVKKKLIILNLKLDCRIILKKTTFGELIEDKLKRLS